jgi:dihydroxyacetone kinase
MKKLINDPTKVVDEMIEGLVMCNPQLKKLDHGNIIVRADCRDEKESSLQ